MFSGFLLVAKEVWLAAIVYGFWGILGGCLGVLTGC